MKTIKEKVLEVLKSSDQLVSVDQLVEQIGNVTKEEVENALVELAQHLEVTEYWYVKDDTDKFEVFDGKLD